MSPPRNFWTLILALAVIVSLSEQTRPGLKLRLSQPGLNYAANEAVKLLSQGLQGRTFNDMSARSGRYEYSISGTTVTSFTHPTSRVVVNTGTGITWSLSGASVRVRGNWRGSYKWWIFTFRGSGSFDVTVSNAGLRLTFGMGSDSSGRPTVSTQSSSGSVGSVNVRFHGSFWSWLYNLFSGFVERPLRRWLENAIGDVARDVVNENGADRLARLKVQVPIRNLGRLDYRLVAPPVFGRSVLESHHKGEFFWGTDNSEAPFSPAPLPAAPGSSRMINVWVSEYVINTLGNILHREGSLQYTFSSRDLSPSDSSALDVACTTGTCVGSFVDQLKDLFPGGVMELSMRTTAPPKIRFRTSEINLDFSGRIEFNVRLPNAQLMLAFTTEMNVTFELTAGLREHNITGTIKSVRVNATLTRTSICNVNLEGLQFAFNQAVNSLIVPQLNQLGQAGVPFPMFDDVTLLNTNLRLLQGALFFQTDARYTPTSRRRRSEPIIGSTGSVDVFYVKFTVADGACTSGQPGQPGGPGQPGQP